MKLNFVKTALMAAMILFAWSCSRELDPIAENGTPAPALSVHTANPITDPICSDVSTFALLDENGNSQIQYCGLFPCNGFQDDWGSAEVYNTATHLYIDVTLSFGWYINTVDSYIGNISVASLNNGIPSIDSDWNSEVLNPSVASYRVEIPLNQLSGCVDLGVHLLINKLDFFGGIDQNSLTDVWLSNPDWNNPATPDENSASAYVAKWCIGSCGPVVTTLTDGECKKCDAEMTVTFYDCASIDVTSCKDLSNVVLAYTDGSWEKFDHLSGNSATFSPSAGYAGKEISHVYIKSGCFKSGEGPGFGRRFDGPCVQ